MDFQSGPQFQKPLKSHSRHKPVSTLLIETKTTPKHHQQHPTPHSDSAKKTFVLQNVSDHGTFSLKPNQRNTERERE